MSFYSLKYINWQGWCEKRLLDVQLKSVKALKLAAFFWRVNNILTIFLALVNNIGIYQGGAVSIDSPLDGICTRLNKNVSENISFQQVSYLYANTFSYFLKS